MQDASTLVDGSMPCKKDPTPVRRSPAAYGFYGFVGFVGFCCLLVLLGWFRFCWFVGLLVFTNGLCCVVGCHFAVTVERPVFDIRPLYVQLTLGATLLDAYRNRFRICFPSVFRFPGCNHRRS